MSTLTTTTPSWTTARATVAALSRSRTPQDPELIAAKRTLKALRLEDRIRSVVNDVVAEAPALTDDQRRRLGTLLSAGATTVGGGVA